MGDIMENKQLCVCLETAKLLKDKGFPQGDSYFVWIHFSKSWGGIWGLCNETEQLNHKLKYPTEGVEVIAAPTTDEILAELPNGVSCERSIDVYKVDQFWVEYQREIFYNKLLPEALASLWLKVKGT